MAFGYVVAQINVTDPETYAGYINWLYQRSSILTANFWFGAVNPSAMRVNPMAAAWLSSAFHPIRQRRTGTIRTNMP